MIGALLASQGVSLVASEGYALLDPAAGIGFAGWPQVAMSLGRLALRVEMKARQRDADALSEMIDLARGLAPQDTGLLLSGVGGENFDGYSEFRASAVRESESGRSVDYARFVEFGTRSDMGGDKAPLTAHEAFFASDQKWFGGARGRAVAKDRRSHRAHGATPAQPFFFPAVNQALARRNADAARIPVEAAAEDGWELG